jgi:glycosyltransferase involved in cell wall biosynthesis
MNILFICHEFPPARIVGGIGIFVKNISKSFVQAGHNVTVVGLYRQDVNIEETLEGVRVIRLAAVQKWGLGWWFQRQALNKKIKDLHAQNKFDIVETSDFDAGFWLISKLDIPYVVRLNGGEVYFRSLLREPLRWHYRVIESASLKKADVISSVSNYTWHETQKLFHLPAQNAAIFPNPVDTAYFNPGKFKTIEGRILYSGTFIRKKGVLELFRSLTAVFDLVPHAHLICVGTDSCDATTNSASTFALALSLIDEKYHSRIQFTGRVEHAQVLSYIQQAEVCVYPSYLEAFPNAWIEAMACGKAVIGSTTGSGPEVIQDGRTGLLCHPSDHEGLSSRIIKILSDSILREQLGTKARQYVVENLDINVLTKLNLQWYKNVIEAYHSS